MKRLHVLAAIVTASAVLAAAPAFAAPAPTKAKPGHKMYKWTDKQGVVHYGSSIPPEYADQQKEQINAQGQTIKTIEGAMTPEQRAAADKAKLDEAAKKEQQEHDKVLLSTYGSVADIERARDSRLAAIQGQINLASSAVSTLEKEGVQLEKQRSVAKDAKQLEKVDAAIAKQRHEMNANQRAVMSKQDEKLEVAKQYDADIARYRELTTAKPKPTP
jgi:Domain of unknown function (DUF4124)